MRDYVFSLISAPRKSVLYKCISLCATTVSMKSLSDHLIKASTSLTYYLNVILEEGFFSKGTLQQMTLKEQTSSFVLGLVHLTLQFL